MQSGVTGQMYYEYLHFVFRKYIAAHSVILHTLTVPNLFLYMYVFVYIFLYAAFFSYKLHCLTKMLVV